MRLRYRKFTDLSTDHLSEQISHLETNSEANRIIFLSDCCKVVYGSDSYRIITLYANNGVFTSSDIYTSRIQDLKWNHFVKLNLLQLHGLKLHVLKLRLILDLL